MKSVLRNPAVMSLSVGHMTADIMSSSLPVLLVAFAATMGLSNFALGTVATLYMLAASLTQPLFGLLADRWETHWIGVAGLLWLASGYFVASFLPGNAAFAALIVAALGTAAFHPQGTMYARRASGGNAASGTSVFFFFGQSGHAIGPVLAGLLLARLPIAQTIWVLAALAIPVGFLLFRYAPRAGQYPVREAAGGEQDRNRISWVPLTMLAFLLVIFFHGWPQAATNTFLPKWLSDSGFTSQQFGGMLGAFMFSSGIGNVFGGWLADRWSRKGVLVSSMALGVLPLYVLYMTPSVGPAAVIATVVAGFAIGMPHSVMVLMAQNLFPGRMGFGSGLVLGFMFSVAALTAWLTGWLGDRLGLQEALQWLPWAALIGTFCALALPRTRPRRVAARATVTAD
jgi:MFS transporter, FSR family, fosmidomycin resistance protein